MIVLLSCRINAVGGQALRRGSANRFDVIGEARSDRDRGRYVRVRIVIFEEKVVGFVVEQSLPPISYDEARRSAWLARQLQPRLLEVVGVEVTIAACP